MIDLFVQFLLLLNKVLFNNLGLTIIVVGIFSRIIFFPLFVQSLRYSKAMRELKPKLDEVKRRYGSDMRRMAAEQSRLFRQAGVNPAAGAVSCLGFLIQAGVFFLLFSSLTRIIALGVNTRFLFWDLAKADTFSLEEVPFALPGGLVLLTAFLTYLQSKTVLPASSQETEKGKASGTEERTDLTEAISASQGTMAYLMPLLIIIWGVKLSSGLILYWLVSTLLGIIQSYQAKVGGIHL